MIEITKTLPCGMLANVERLAREDFERAGYRIVEVRAIADLGHNGRYREWAVTANCERIADAATREEVTR